MVLGFRNFVTTLPETIQVFVTTGAEDVLVHVAVPSTQALRDFVLDSLTKRREVAGVRTEVVFDHERKHVIPPSERLAPTTPSVSGVRSRRRPIRVGG